MFPFKNHIYSKTKKLQTTTLSVNFYFFVMLYFFEFETSECDLIFLCESYVKTFVVMPNVQN